LAWPKSWRRHLAVGWHPAIFQSHKRTNNFIKNSRDKIQFRSQSRESKYPVFNQMNEYLIIPVSSSSLKNQSWAFFDAIFEWHIVRIIAKICTQWQDGMPHGDNVIYLFGSFYLLLTKRSKSIHNKGPKNFFTNSFYLLLIRER
jgi:hypothetical protein